MIGFCTGMIPVAMSQLTLGRTGDIMMAVLTIFVVVMAVSAQIHSLSAIFMYDIYQTYISPFRPMSGYPDQIVAQYLLYNRRSVFIGYAVTILLSIITFPTALIYMTIELVFAYKVLLLAIAVASCVLPVCLSIAWHRTTGWGLCSGIWLGLAAGIVAWLVYASTFPGGLDDFVVNTTRQTVMITFMSTCFVAGGIFCFLVSLCNGGLRKNAEEEWEKCLQLDNPAKPWVLQYAADSAPSSYVGMPTYQQVLLSMHRSTAAP